MSDDWLKVIKERLEAYEEPVPEDLWDRIEATLTRRDRARARRRAVLLWTGRVAVAASLAVGVFAGIRLVNNKTYDTGEVVSDLVEGRSSSGNPSSSVNTGGGSAPSAEPLEIIPSKGKGELVAMAEVLPKEPAKLHYADDLSGKTLPDVAEAAPVEAVPVEARPVESAPEESIGTDGKDAKAEPGLVTNHDGEDWSGYMSATDEEAPDWIGKLSAGVSLASTSSNLRDVMTVDTRTFYYGAAPLAVTGDGGAFLVRGFNPERLSDKNAAYASDGDVSAAVVKDETHRRPVRASFTLSYPLTGTLAIESGVTYSMLYSKYMTSSGSTVAENVQTLNFLGVPLNLRATILGEDRFSLYVTGGGMMEKCVSGKVKTSVTVNGAKNGGQTSANVDVDPLYWSLNAAAGAQLNLTSRAGVYVEPGLSYHLNGDSKVRCIYSERPLDFILTFGARFTFR